MRANLSERLRHLPEPPLRNLNALLHAEIEIAREELFLNPFRELTPLVHSRKALANKERCCTRTKRFRCKYLVGEDHEAIIGLAAQTATNALCRLSHGVEGEEIILPNLELFTQILESCAKNATLSIDIGYSEH